VRINNRINRKTTKKINKHKPLKFGLDDPATTGVLWEAIGPIAGCIETFQEISVVFIPEFNEDVLETDAHGDVR